MSNLEAWAVEARKAAERRAEVEAYHGYGVVPEALHDAAAIDRARAANKRWQADHGWRL